MREGGATPIFSLWINHVGQASAADLKFLHHLLQAHRRGNRRALQRAVRCSMVRASLPDGYSVYQSRTWRTPMKVFQRVMATLGALALFSGLALPGGVALAQTKTKVSVAVGGAGCLCYLPTVLAKQLGEYDKAGLDVELINFKGGSQALQAVIGGSPPIVSGYYEHSVNPPAQGHSLVPFVWYDRFPPIVLA